MLGAHLGASFSAVMSAGHPELEARPCGCRNVDVGRSGAQTMRPWVGDKDSLCPSLPHAQEGAHRAPWGTHGASFSPSWKVSSQGMHFAIKMMMTLLGDGGEGHRLGPAKPCPQGLAHSRHSRKMDRVAS